MRCSQGSDGVEEGPGDPTGVGQGRERAAGSTTPRITPSSTRSWGRMRSWSAVASTWSGRPLEDRGRELGSDDGEVTVRGGPGVVRRGQCQRTPGPALADDESGDRRTGRRHRAEQLRDRRARALPLRLRVVGRARGVHQGQHRDAEPVREADQPGGGAVARGAGRGPGLGGVGDAAAVPLAETAEHAAVGAAAAVAAEGDPMGEVGVQVGLRAGSFGRAGTLDRRPAGAGEVAGAEGGRNGSGRNSRGGGGRGLGAGPEGPRPARQQPQPPAQRHPQFRRRHHRVGRARRHLRLRRVRRRVRVRRADPGAGEADLRARQGEDDVGSRAQRGPAAARRGIPEDGDLREARLPGQRRLTGHALELGQREHALLHTAATGGDQRDDREPVCAGVGVRRLQPVAGAFAERAAEEAELEGEQHGPRPRDVAVPHTTDSCSPVRSAARAREAS